LYAKTVAVLKFAKKIFLHILILLPLIGIAQQCSNYRFSKIIVKSDTIHLDTLSIIPGSLVVRDSTGKQIDSTHYYISYPEALILLKPLVSIHQPVLMIYYRVFPYNFSLLSKHKDIGMTVKDKTGTLNPFSFTDKDQTLDIFKLGGLNKNGSISRGVTIGNSQDVVVNSSFNLQLSGKLSEDITVLAAITDNNVPVQPDGNTQQIQDFDKVFIQLSSKRSSLTAGDFELTRPQSYFMNFYKKAQGGSFTTSFLTSADKKKKNTMTIKGAAAISKGKYTENTFTGIEGNQGPYKLTGADNETYIIVLSGSEKVYIDGLQMVRGQENDYTIDYNTAELTFTTKRLITKDSRISIEFEYSDMNYARSLFYAGTDYSTKKLTMHFNFFSEQDIKNQPIQQALSTQDKQLLAQVGDSINQAVVPYADSIAFTNAQVLYKKTYDTVAGVVYYPVYVYSTNPDSAHYQLGFSIVGANKGNYVQIQSTANGRVFKWVAPIANIKQGNYEPVVLLVTPKKKQMATLSTEYAISKRTKASVELAMSNNDINLFSTADKGNDLGYGVKTKIKNVLPLNKKDSTGWSLTSEADNEFTDKNFTPIDRYRDVEFDRDWNLSNIIVNSNENISSLKFTLADKKSNFTSYQFRSFFAGSQYTGLQNVLNANLGKKGFLLTFNGSYLTSKDKFSSTRFIRSNAGFSKKFKRIIVGVKEEQEYNTFFKLNTDSLQQNSFSYNQLEGYINNPDTSKTKYTLFYKRRVDQLPLKNSLNLATTAQDVGVSFEMLKKANNKLSITNTYRKLQVNDSSLTAQKDDKSLLSRLQYNVKLFKGAISSSTYYEIGSGLEVKKEYSYLQVTPGQGIYIWTDYNHDNVQQLDEFEIATIPGIANYIRVYTPTNQYVKSYTNQFNEVFTLSPVTSWVTAKGFKKFLSRFSDQATYSIDHKNTSNNGFKAYNPFMNEISDTTLLSTSSALRNSFYFNRSSAVFSMDYEYSDSRNKILLVDGFDSRSAFSHEVNVKWNISRKFSFTTKYNTGEKTSNSDYLTTRDFDIVNSEIGPVFSYQPNVSFRIALNYTYTDKKNKQGVIGEKAFLNDAGVDIKYNVLSKGSLLMKVSYVRIKYNSDESTPVAYEMLEGLKSGNNATWTLSYQRNLSGNLQLTLNYEGRKSQDVKTIHVGSVQLRAYF